MKILRVGIVSYDEMKNRTLAIARGERKPGRNEPKVWFTSAESFAKVLSDKNRELLNTIVEAQPRSLTELEALTGRRKSNLSRTLKTMARYGLVRLKKGERGAIVPEVPYDQISLVVPLTAKSRTRGKAARGVTSGAPLGQ